MTAAIPVAASNPPGAQDADGSRVSAAYDRSIEGPLGAYAASGSSGSGRASASGSSRSGARRDRRCRARSTRVADLAGALDRAVGPSVSFRAIQRVRAACARVATVSRRMISASDPGSVTDGSRRCGTDFARGRGYTDRPRGCGGIGRRARFRSVCPSGRGGSSPLIRIAAVPEARLLALERPPREVQLQRRVRVPRPAAGHDSDPALPFHRARSQGHGQQDRQDLGQRVARALPEEVAGAAVRRRHRRQVVVGRPARQGRLHDQRKPEAAGRRPCARQAVHGEGRPAVLPGQLSAAAPRTR